MLEWDAAAYFNHHPKLRLAVTSGTARLSWPAQPGWGYRVQSSTNLLDWLTVTTTNSTSWDLETTVPNSSTVPVFWRLELREGGF